MENTCTPNIKSSYTYEDLLASGRGELFGKEGPQLPAPTMLMMDRIVKMTEDGGAFGKGYIEAELDIHPDLPSIPAGNQRRRQCRLCSLPARAD